MFTEAKLTLARKVAVLALVFALPMVSRAYDYLVKAAPPHLEKDGATTFLMDFSKRKPGPDYATGRRATVTGRPLPDGGLRGTVTVPSTGNFAPGAWTVEMILRLPRDQANVPSIPVGGWADEGNYLFTVALTAGKGPGFSLITDKGDAGPTRGVFNLQTWAGGDGVSLGTQAAGEWVYFAFGIDFARQRSAAIVRDLDGHVLKQAMQFVANPEFSRDFLAGVRQDREAAAVAKCWADMAKSFARGVPPRLVFGSSDTDLLTLRLSRAYREEVLEPQPMLAAPGETVWTGEALDPQRARAVAVARTLGYPGGRHEHAVTREESLVTLTGGAPPVVVSLKGMPVGLYTFNLYGSIEPQGRKDLERVWRPCAMEFEARDARGRCVEMGRRLLKQGFGLRRMQGFHLHVNEPGDYTVRFRLLPSAQETVSLQRIAMVDNLVGLPDEAVKREQAIAQGATAQLQEMTDRRRQRDADIWASLPPLNLHYQVHAQVAPFLKPPAAAKVRLPAWRFEAGNSERDCLAPLTMVDPETRTVFPHEQVVAGAPWPGEVADDGTGVFFPKREYPDLATDIYISPRAQLLGTRIRWYLGLLGTWDYRRNSLPAKYFADGDPETGHDAAMALVRLAYDWPALEMNLHELRLCTGTPDLEFNVDWSGRRNGKYFYEGWSGDMAVGLITAYDQLFPYIQGNQLFADAVHRFIPWIRTPQDVTRFLDRWLVFASVRDYNGGLIRAADVAGVAGQVLGPHRETVALLDLTRQYAELYPCQGTYQELYGTALSRSGCYYTGSFLVYALAGAEGLVEKAFVMRTLRQMEFRMPMDLSDLPRYPKVRGAANFLLDLWVAGGFPFMAGDASGGPHTGSGEFSRVSARSRRIYERAYALTSDPRFAVLLAGLFDSQEPGVVQAAAGRRHPVLQAPSRVVPDYGAIIECTPDEVDVTRKTAATLRLGIGVGHAHHDCLDVNFFAMGLPMAVDLACRSEGSNWSRPHAAWAFLHNRAIAHDEENPATAGVSDGEPWLRAFAPPLVRASYINAKGDVTLDRDLLMMAVGDTGTFYAFDVQRLAGGRMHTWCFHGCESEELALNVPMAAKTVRWTDRTLEGTQKAGTAPAVLQATWTMTRGERSVPHPYDGGGVVRTAACEPNALGERYDAGLPPVRVRATLLGHAGESVFQGNPYSQSYRYCFPFLWVQQPRAQGESVYPAIYEWYRGDVPVVDKVELTRRVPLTVTVSTTDGQVDEYVVTPTGFSAVSRDAQGLRWAKFSGLAEAQSGDLAVRAPRAEYRTTIGRMDYGTRRLSTADPLPADPGAVVGNDGRRCWLQLRGKGTEFTWDDDLLIHEGRIEEINVVDAETVIVRTNQRLLFADGGNRRAGGMVQCSEDLAWQFRNGRVIRRPKDGKLTAGVFTDANGDGLIHLKTYEVGLGDTIVIPTDIEIRRTAQGYAIRSNVPVEVRLGGKVVRDTPPPQEPAPAPGQRRSSGAAVGGRAPAASPP